MNQSLLTSLLEDAKLRLRLHTDAFNSEISDLIDAAAADLLHRNAIQEAQLEGVDIDPLSVKTARENGIKNGYKEPQLTFVNGDLADKVSGKYDIVIANIVADVIIRLCDNVTDFVKEGGVFITSGIIDTRADEVIEAITAAGFSIAARYDDGGWVSLAAILN